MQLAGIARKVLMPRKNENVPIAEINNLMDTCPPGEMYVDVRYFLGQFLKLLGHQQQAVEYWQDAVTRGPFDRVNCTLAGHQLAQLHGTSRD